MSIVRDVAPVLLISRNDSQVRPLFIHRKKAHVALIYFDTFSAILSQGYIGHSPTGAIEKVIDRIERQLTEKFNSLAPCTSS